MTGLSTTFAPLPSKMSMSCGVPAVSLLSKWIVNGLSAGAFKVAVSNLRPSAVTWRPPPGPPEPGGPEPGAPEPGAPDGPGEPPAAPPPAADRGGNQPALRATAATTRSANTVTSVFGQPGAGSFSRWPVVSARTTWRYSLRASLSQPRSATIRHSSPIARIGPGNTRPRNRTKRPSEARIGRKLGPG